MDLRAHRQWFTDIKEHTKSLSESQSNTSKTYIYRPIIVDDAKEQLSRINNKIAKANERHKQVLSRLSS